VRKYTNIKILKGGIIMGLDMFLNKAKRPKLEYFDKDYIKSPNVIKNEIAYWRKANAIHNYFVHEVQDGIDDCSYHNEVTKDILEDLLRRCNIVLDNPDLASQLLPTANGFLFGSTNYDELYFSDIRYTIKIITKILETTDFETEIIYYLSSW
jgi:hypothetical protein